MEPSQPAAAYLGAGRQRIAVAMHCLLGSIWLATGRNRIVSYFSSFIICFSRGDVRPITILWNAAYARSKPRTRNGLCNLRMETWKQYHPFDKQDRRKRKQRQCSNMQRIMQYFGSCLFDSCISTFLPYGLRDSPLLPIILTATLWGIASFHGMSRGSNLSLPVTNPTLLTVTLNHMGYAGQEEPKIFTSNHNHNSIPLIKISTVWSSGVLFIFIKQS